MFGCFDLRLKQFVLCSRVFLSARILLTKSTYYSEHRSMSMNTLQESQETESAATEAPDEFASGSPNRTRLGAIRFAKWLFTPPYFPSELVWLLCALIIGNIALELLPQPAAYWIDPSTSTQFSFFGTPLRWGIWNIVFLISYALVTALILNLLNIKLAFAIWMGLGLYHLAMIPEAFRCSAVFYLPFETPGNCSTVHTIAILLTGIAAGGIVWMAATLHLIPGLATEDLTVTSDGNWLRNLRRISMTWIGLCTLAVVATIAFAPKPVWKPIQTALVPTGRTEAAFAYDTERSVAVLFGGTSSWTQAGGWKSINDTWEWDGKDWRLIQPQHSPAPRYAASMVFDEKRGVTVLFAGMQPDPTGRPIFYDDTWEWDGGDWHEVVPAKRPPARQDAAMFFDPARGTTVIYGGYYFDPESQTTVFLDDAWEWDGKNWQPLVFNELRRNSSAAIVFDPIRQLPLLMDVEGLWSWQDARWIPLSFPDNPPGRWNSQMVFNPDSQRIVMFGGFKDKDVFDDTWIYNGQGWEQLITKTKPPRRNGHNMFYDQTRGTVVLFGGLDGGVFYDDMWELVQP